MAQMLMVTDPEINQNRAKEILFLLDKLITGEKDAQTKAMLQEVKTLLTYLVNLPKPPYPSKYPYPQAPDGSKVDSLKEKMGVLEERISKLEGILEELKKASKALSLEDIKKSLDEVVSDKFNKLRVAGSRKGFIKKEGQESQAIETTEKKELTDKDWDKVLFGGKQ